MNYENLQQDKYKPIVQDLMPMKEHRRKLIIWVMVSLIISCIVAAGVAAAIILTRPKAPILIPTKSQYLEEFAKDLDSTIKNNQLDLKADNDDKVIIDFDKDIFAPTKISMWNQVSKRKNENWDQKIIKDISLKQVNWTDRSVAFNYSLSITKDDQSHDNIITIPMSNLNDIFLSGMKTPSGANPATLNITLGLADIDDYSFNTTNNIYNFDFSKADQNKAKTSFKNYYAKGKVGDYSNLGMQSGVMAINQNQYNNVGKTYFSGVDGDGLKLPVLSQSKVDNSYAIGRTSLEPWTSSNFKLNDIDTLAFAANYNLVLGSSQNDKNLDHPCLWWLFDVGGSQLIPTADKNIKNIVTTGTQRDNRKADKIIMLPDKLNSNTGIIFVELVDNQHKKSICYSSYDVANPNLITSDAFNLLDKITGDIKDIVAVDNQLYVLTDKNINLIKIEAASQAEAVTVEATKKFDDGLTAQAITTAKNEKQILVLLQNKNDHSLVINSYSSTLAVVKQISVSGIHELQSLDNATNINFAFNRNTILLAYDGSSYLNFGFYSPIKSAKLITFEAISITNKTVQKIIPVVNQQTFVISWKDNNGNGYYYWTYFAYDDLSKAKL